MLSKSFHRLFLLTTAGLACCAANAAGQASGAGHAPAGTPAHATVPANAATAKAATPIGQQIDAIVTDVLARAHYPGVAVAIRKGGETIYRKGFGLADIENQLAVTPETVFPIGSISKSFTALAVMQLVEQGKLSLDAPLRTYLADYRGPARDVALRHLLNHTSGIPNYTSAPGFPPDPQLEQTHAQVVGYVAEKPLQFAPGERFSYSNTNSYLLGMVVEKVTGQSLPEYLRMRVFEPFGMLHTYFAGYRPIIGRRSRGYELEGGNYLNAQQYDVNYPFAAGAVLSTVDDLLRYQQGVFESSQVSPQTRARLLTLDKLNDGTPLYYALGCLIVRQFEGHRKLSHSGVISGFSAHYAHYPDDELTVVVLTNLEHGAIPPYAFERKIARAALGLPAPVIVDAPLSAAQLQRFAGDYDVAPFTFNTGRFGFVAQDGRLSLSFGGAASGAPLMPLRYQGRGRFVAADDDEFTFSFSSERPARAVVAEFFDGSFPAARHIEPPKNPQAVK